MTRPLETSQERTLAFGSDPSLRRRFMVLDEPLRGNLRFGSALEVLDKLAEDAALGYARRFNPEVRCVTAAIDNVVVRTEGDVGRDMVFHARLNYVGKTSMEVGIRVVHPGDPPVHLASCYFTMVARLGEGDGARGFVLPPLACADEMEKLRFQKAVERREAYRRRQDARFEPPTREEYELLARLHREQEKPAFDGLLASGLAASAWERMYPEQENVPQKIFGGYLVRRAYELASVCAEQAAPDRPVPVAVNRINFFHPVRMGDKLHFTSRVVYSGRTSLCVETAIERISRDRTVKALSNTCLFTFVNVGRDMDPRPVPPIYPTTYAEDASYLDAHRRNVEHRRRRARGEDPEGA